MRPYCLILVALTILLACFDAAMANSSPELSLTANDQPTKRMLRTVADVDDTSDEERILGLNHFKLWRMKRSANSELKKADKAAAKAAKELEKATTAAAKKSATEAYEVAKARADEMKLFAKWIGKKWTPDYIKKKLGLVKLGDRAPESKNYKIWERYEESYKIHMGKASSPAAAGAPAAAAGAPAAAAAAPAAAAAAPAAAAAAPAAAAAAPAAAAAAPAAAAAAPAAAAGAPAAGASVPRVSTD